MSLSTTRISGNALGLPAPAPLPNLRDALARRASIFGTADHDEVRATSKGWRATFGSALRRLADILEPAQVAL